MNAPVNQSGSNAQDNVITNIYRQAADETVPDRLNDAILDRAQSVGAARNPKIWQIGWLQPIALVAVVGLSLAFVLEFSELTHELTDTGIPTSAVERGSNPLDRAADAALEQIRDAESLAQKNPGVTDLAAPPIMLEAGNPENLERAENPRCSIEQRSTTALWWQCIQSLERRGYTEAATIEYEALFAAYPAFEAP